MMPAFRTGFLLTTLTFLFPAFVISLPGCSYFQSAESEEDGEFADFDRDEKSDSAEEDLARDPKSGELELKLNVGDRFPLQKRIDQRLTQGTSSTGMLVNRSLVEMMLSLVVDEIQDGRKKLSVRYHRIQYSHDIAGRKVEYNSEDGKPVPTEALAYAGLKDNGFSFWIGPDNRVIELLGFQEFLQRCVQNVPPAYRDLVLKQLEGTQGEDGLSNFVDDGIGLLPYSDDPRHPAVAVKVGSTWELKPRRSEGPIPIAVNTRCVLKNLTDTSAEIGLVGSISGPSFPVTIPDGQRNMRITIKGGHCAGNCMVDRRTGLPTQSEVNRYLEMSVQMPDGVEIPQRKEVQTTITAFLDQSGLREASGGNGDSNQFSRASSSFGHDFGSNRVTQAGGSNSAESTEDRGSEFSRHRSQFDRSGTR